MIKNKSNAQLAALGKIFFFGFAVTSVTLTTFALTTVALTTTASADDKKDVFNLCENDSECLLVKNECGSVISINRKFQDQYKKPSPPSDLYCRNFRAGLWPKGAIAKCREHQCKAELNGKEIR